MSKLQRIRKVINWLIFMEFAVNEKEIAEKLGYTHSSFSQIVNGKVPLSDKFIGRLCATDQSLNKIWIESGDGEMLNNQSGNDNSTVSLKDVWEVIKSQSESLKAKDRQIDELISLLKEKIGGLKKADALGEKNS